MTFEELRKQLRTASEQQFWLGAAESEIAAAERDLDVKLPASYRQFLREFGWGGVSHLEIFGLGGDVPNYLNLVSVAHRERTEMRPPIPRYLVPIMNDGAGNHYCLDTRQFSGNECPVAFWNHELGDLQQPQRIAPTFTDWLAEQLKEVS